MSIYVKDLHKPTTCSNCFAFRYDYEDGIAMCNISNEIIKWIPYEDRLLDSVIDNIKSEDCPIIEVEDEYENILSASSY